MSEREALNKYTPSQYEEYDSYTESVCQHMQQLGVETKKIKYDWNCNTIHLNGYGHCVIIYFHKKSYTIYFTPIDSDYAHKEVKHIAESIKKEFNVQCSVSNFSESVVRRRVEMARSIEVRMSKCGNDLQQYEHLAKSLKDTLNFTS